MCKCVGLSLAQVCGEYVAVGICTGASLKSGAALLYFTQNSFDVVKRGVY